MVRHLLVRPISWRGPLTPLLKKEGNLCDGALIAQRPKPVWMRWTRIRAALAAGNDPIDAMMGRHARGRASIPPIAQEGLGSLVAAQARVRIAVVEIERPKQWLTGQEADARRDREQVRNAAVSLLLVFNGGAEPDVIPPGAELFWPARQHAEDVLRALRQQEPVKIRSAPDHVPCATAPVLGNLIVEEIGEGIRKDLGPLAGQLGGAIPFDRI